MTSLDTRRIERDSLLLMASLRLGRGGPGCRIKMRNLSAGGMLAEGQVDVTPGTRVLVELRNIGIVEGSVAWVAGDRFGVAFSDPVDPKLARAPVATGPADLASPRFTRPPPGRSDGTLRAI